jgi:hypothetical protein
MGFWERVKKNLPEGMKEGIGAVREGAVSVTSQAGRMARKGAATFKAEAGRVANIGRLRYQRFNLNQKAHDKLARLGGRVYDHASKDLKGFRLDLKSQKLILEAKKIDTQIKKLDAEIKKLSKKGLGK